MHEHDARYRRYFWIALTAVSLLRLAAACTIPLTGDEAYYWTWTQHPALGYHDHPPMVAWIIAASTRLLGTSTWSVRLPFVLMGVVAAALTWQFALEWSGSPRAAWLAGVCPLAVPLFTAAGIGVFPDSPMLTACAAFFLFAWRAIQRDRTTDWIAAGVCAGLAGLSKLTGLYLMPALVLYLVSSPSRRERLRRQGPWIAIAVSLLVLSPFIYWNVTHGFESVAYQYGSRLGSPAGHRRLYTPTFLMLTSIAISPFFLVMLPLAVWHAARQRDDPGMFIASLSAPLPLLFLTCSLLTKIGLHWTAPGILASFSAFGRWLDAASTPELRNRRIFAQLGLAFCLFINGIVYLFALSPSTLVALLQNGVQITGVNHGRPLRIQELTETLGYPEAGAAVLARLDDAQPQPFLLTTNYTLSSALWFYSGREFHVIMGSSVGAQYDHWDNFPSLLGQDALYVDTSPIESREDVWERLHQAFATVELLPPTVTHGHGVEARTFYFARCRNFRNDIFTAMQSIHRNR